ncbi:MAG: DUF5312 family protein [Spirochaetota bacterium]
MPYDKENIEKAHKAGVFVDSPIDPQVLETEEKDRMRMKKELEDINQKDKDKSSNKSRSDLSKPKSDLKAENESIKKRLKLNILEKIIYWIKGLFGGVISQRRYLTKKELKNARHIIQNFTPIFYNFKNPNTVIPRIKKEFAQTLYNIYKIYYKIYKLFEDAVIDEEDIDINKDSFFLAYESELISEDAQRILERLSRKRIYELYDNHDNADMFLGRELNNFQNEVESSDYKNIETYSEVFEYILLLRKINFKGFFSLFDKNFVESLKYHPNFNRNVYVNELRECDNFLKDLDIQFTAVSKVSLPENVAIHFDNVVSKFIQNNSTKEEDELSFNTNDTEEEEDEEVNEETNNTEYNNQDKKSYYSNIDGISSKDIRDLLKNIGVLVRSGVLKAMVKYIYKDPAYSTRNVNINNMFFERYLDVLTYKVNMIAETSEEEIKNKHLKENIRALFYIEDDSDVNINYIENYTPQVNSKLVEKKLPQYEHMKSVALLKMFFERHYLKYMRELVDKLVVEAEFADKSTGQAFSNNIYNLEDDYNNLKDFEKSMKESESVKVFLRGVNVSGSLDASQKNVIVNKISDLNSNAKEILESTLPKFLEIQMTLDKAIEDSKSKNPNFIYNIKTISGLANKSYLNQLKNVTKKLSQFLKIMKNFHLISTVNNKKK